MYWTHRNKKCCLLNLTHPVFYRLMKVKAHRSEVDMTQSGSENIFHSGRVVLIAETLVVVVVVKSDDSSPS